MWDGNWWTGKQIHISKWKFRKFQRKAYKRAGFYNWKHRMGRWSRILFAISPSCLATLLRSNGFCPSFSKKMGGHSSFLGVPNSSWMTAPVSKTEVVKGRVQDWGRNNLNLLVVNSPQSYQVLILGICKHYTIWTNSLCRYDPVKGLDIESLSWITWLEP